MRRVLFLLVLLSLLSAFAVSADVNLKPSFAVDNVFRPSEEERLLNIIREIKNAIDDDPEDYLNYGALAFAYDYAGFHREAVIALKLEIKYYPDSDRDLAVAYGNLAREYIILEQLDQAKDAIDKALDLDPDNYINNMHLIQYYLMKGQYKEAALAMKKESDSSNDEDTYFNWYCYAFFDLDVSSSELVDLFQYTVELDPESYDARRTFATAMRGNFDNLEEKFPKIIEEYKKALGRKPDHIPTHICIANTYMFMAMQTEDSSYNKSALEWFDKAYEIDPENEKLLYATANFYYYNKRYDEAILKLEEAIGLGFENEHITEALSSMYNDKAYSLYQDGEDLGEGLELIGKAIALNPNNGVILSTKAELLYKLGRFEEAYTYIKKGIALEPDHPEIQEDFKMIEEAMQGVVK